ncbi:MAG: hypothetical protein Kow0069_04880 [Promethearchaeota archaeon]
MIRMEETRCETCAQEGVHLCNAKSTQEKALGREKCKYCGTENVLPGHVCKPKIPNLTHVCINCGRAADDPNLLCNPAPVDEATKKKWAEVPARGTDVLTCKNCEQPISKPGHYCDPVLPYTCKYCGAHVTNSRHVCAEIIKQAKYYCNLCDRIAVEKDDICAPVEIK